MDYKRRDIVVAVIGTLLIHAVLVGVASFFYVGGAQALEEETARVFRVDLVDLQDTRRFERRNLAQEAEILEEKLEQEFEIPPEPDWPEPVQPKPEDIQLTEPDIADLSDRPDLDPADLAPGPESLLPSGRAQEDLETALVAIAEDVQRPELERRYLPVGEGTGATTDAGEGGTGPGDGGIGRRTAWEDALPGELLGPLTDADAGMGLASAYDAAPEDLFGGRSAEEILGTASLSKIRLPEFDNPDALTRNLFGGTSIPPEVVDPDVNFELYVYRPEGEDGYFMITIRPKPESPGLPVMPKDIIFVLDASASMGRRSFFGVQDGLQDCIPQLRPGDAFNVIGFRSRVLAMDDEHVVPANDENKLEAERFIGELETSGGTDIYRSLYPLALQEGKLTRPFIVFLVSDGRPTVGIRNSQTIINDLTRENEGKASFFAFGAGMSMNEYLLDLLTRRNKGYVKFSEDITRLQQEVLDFYSQFSDPVLVRLNANYGGINEDQTYPKSLPDLYRGSHLRLFGRLQGQEKIYMRITGLSHTGRKEMVFRATIPGEDNAGEEIARLWGYNKAYHIIEQISANRATAESVALLDELRTKYRFSLPYQVEAN